MKPKRGLYFAGALAAIFVLAGSLLDIIASIILGGDLNALPETAIERFAQIRTNPLLGMYNLDFLNLITVSVMILCTLALCLAHRKTYTAESAFALVISVIGTAIFVSANPALPMLDLSHKYFAATPERSSLLAAAGEAILARGEHGGAGVFPGFAFPIFSNVVLSFLMLMGKIFGKACAWFGIIGNACLFVYVCLVTFVPGTRVAVTAIAAPGGILAMIWLALSAKGLFRMEGNDEK